MKNSTNKFLWKTIPFIATILSSCVGQTPQEKSNALRKQQQQTKDSINQDNSKFGDYVRSVKTEFTNTLTKDGDFFIDYTTGTIEVPQGYIWQLGKYNVWAREWDTVNINNPNIATPCDRKRLTGDNKPLCSGSCDNVVDVNKIIINNCSLSIPAAPCADDNTASINNMTARNTNWNRLAIDKVFLPAGTKICVPINRYERESGTHGILTIVQYKLKKAEIITEFEKIVSENKRRGSSRYSVWNLADSITNNTFDVISEISNNNDWYKP